MQEYKSIGLKLTPQRLAILEYLKDNREHPSAADIYAAVSEKYQTMSFATVYNTLKALKDREHVLELAIDGGKKRYDPDTIRHHHLICTECRKIVDIFVEFDLSVPEAELNGFEIRANHVDFYGLCPECREIGPVQRQTMSHKKRKG
ncbi:Fur family transcriptional regulator, peroxide stress response regulator [Syntrophus gentianae]|uniref:Ferric uptake regulation protein n=1 Tax=Syntrophus gentianae TaxID=43775 RepID=A0A1H7ZPZ5_9BACT|nr:transcriptional repressor [Syntrophus gentianae]SEM59487.1 Fur family transcriptional regulator, peroxide stress response regulator [Syntrophus gentianae]